MQWRLPDWLGNLLLLLLCFTFQEGLFRLVFPLPEISNFNRIRYANLHINSTLKSGAPLMHASFVWRSEPDGVSFINALNLYGFRDRSWRVKKRPGYERVVFVGDSFVEGFMAPADATIPQGYQDAADRAHSAIESMNFGIGGIGFDQYVPLIRDAMRIFRPDRVFLVVYANDFPSARFNPDVLDAPIQPRFFTWYMPRLLHVLKRAWKQEPVPRRWHSAPFPFVPAVPSALNPWTTNAESLQEGIAPGIAQAMQAGRFNPFVSNQLAFFEKHLQQPVDIEDAVQALHHYVEKHGARLYIAYIPFSAQVSDYYITFQHSYTKHKEITSLLPPAYAVQRESLARVCARQGIPFLDFTPLLRHEEQQGRHLYWDYDEHMRGAGYLWVGHTLFAWTQTINRPSRGASSR